jgi:hypothetical protein
MQAAVTNEQAVALALAALGWIVSGPARAQRLLDLTGLSPQELRERAGEPAVLAAALGFLEGYEPDLIACAEAVESSPAVLVAARACLETQ